jgi:acetolactate synthase I/II/III large subunit
MRLLSKFFSRQGIINSYTIKNTKKISGADIVYRKLQEHKVKDVFLYSGGSIMPLVDKFYQGSINYYINTHEQNCGHAATGYAKSSQQTGVVITTSGPGITNMVTPMLDAQNDSTPLVVISGQVGLNVIGTDAFQEAPATQITQPFTKWSYCIKSIEEIPQVLNQAFYLAQEGKKGVVHLDLPKCVSTDTIEEDKILDLIEYQTYNDYYLSQRKDITKENTFLEESVDEVAQIITNSQKPIFYIGQGCLGAERELKKNIYKNRIPVTTTIHGKGIFSERDMMSLKWCGMHGMASANYAIQESDCIIAVGSRFDDRTTGNTEYYAPVAQEKKQIIHVDIEPKQFHKNVKSHHNIICDSKIFLEMLYHKIGINSRLEWMSRVGQLKTLYDFQYRTPTNQKLNTPMAINSINEYLHSGEKMINNYHISTGVGNHQMMTYQFIEGLKPNSIHSSGSLGVMGAGLPYAVGIQIANPESLVIDIDGDSSFMMTMSDLKTIKEYNLPVKIAIMNDSRQMMVNIWERLFFEERYTATINNNNPDFGALAESFGIMSFRCDNSTNLTDITNQFLDYPGPALCEYVVEPEICLPLVGPGKALDEMIMFKDYHGLEDKKRKGLKLPSLKFDPSSVPS